MRTPSLTLALGLSLLASPALATTTEPNGKVIPIDSMNKETQLYTMFALLGDPVDWQKDSGTKPDTFSPLCEFTATYVLNQAGNHFGISWYNATGTAPKSTELHQILPPNSPVGTEITSADIKSNPAYAGGLIGFALVGGQTHYSEQSWDPMCSGCNPPAPWISAVIYPSKKTPNAFYIAFEDGNFGPNPNDFNNDGDFNDDVFFLTGLTCVGGAQPCDTGQPGICSQGLTQCSATGLTCRPVNQPATKETCNGLDDNCNGQSDEGSDLCQAGYVCDKGTCVQKCGTSEFACPPGLACSANGFCVEAACVNVPCPAGQVCVGGSCKAPCDGIACPFSQVCRVGKCVDPCQGVTCASGQVCEQGVCLAGCNCAPCATGDSCNQASGACIETSCMGKMCAAGTHCAGGNCVDDCAGATCPAGEVCQMGKCITDPNTSGSGTGIGSTGVFMEDVGGGSPNGSSASGTGTGTGGAGGTGSAAGGADGGPGSTGGCGCRLGDADATSEGLLGAGLLGLLFASRRRKRAQG